MFTCYYTLIAIICSGVGAATLGVWSSSAASETFAVSPGEIVFTGVLWTSSITSSEANKFLASKRSY